MSTDNCLYKVIDNDVDLSPYVYDSYNQDNSKKKYR